MLLCVSTAEKRQGEMFPCVPVGKPETLTVKKEQSVV